MASDYNLQTLKRLQNDSEKQLLEFNEIIPIEHNSNDVYSPKLVNLMLSVGPQIENVVDIILKELHLEVKEAGVPSRIKVLNQNGVLSNFKITSTTNRLQYTPFNQEFTWWNTYNNTKHDLAEKQFKITYLSVMESLAVLAGLHRLADVVIRCNDEQRKHVLEKDYWRNSMNYQGSDLLTESQLHKIIPPSWTSSLFQIHNYFVYQFDA